MMKKRVFGVKKREQKNPALVAFGQRLHEALKASPLTKRAFCAQTATSLGALHGYEHGTMAPSLVKILAFADALAVDVAWLAAGEEAQVEQAPVTHNPLDEDLLAQVMVATAEVLADVDRPAEQKARVVMRYYQYLQELAVAEEEMEAAG